MIKNTPQAALTARLFTVLSAIVLLGSCSKNSAVSLVSKTQNIANEQSVIARSKTAAFIKIACEGTSLTYGEDIKGTDTVSAALPNGPTRAKIQYPAAMLQALSNPRLYLSVRGYPGDRTTEGLSRWKDSTSADVCIIEYGTNDAYNFAGYASGNVPVKTYKAQLRQLITRRIAQGAWVIVCISPILETGSNEINLYRSAALAVASEYSVNVFDVTQSTRIVSSPYSDVVHFNSNGYQKWGIDIAQMLKGLD